MKTSLTSFVSLCLLSLSGFSCSDATQFAGGSAPGKADATRAVPDSPMTYAGEDSPESDPQSTWEKPPLTAQSTTTEGLRRGNNQPLSPEELARIVQQCQNSPKKTLVQKITFPENRNCAWNQKGNLGRRDRYLQAIEIQAATIELPEQSQLCGISLASAATTLHYDDFLVLTLNDTILLSSNQQIIRPLAKPEARTYQWNFEPIRGRAVDFDSPPYCAGAESCQVPVTDIPGRFAFSLDPTRLDTIAAQVVGLHDFDFALIATGDNDERDCYHTEFSLEFQLQYIEGTAP
jgi:hypothetical protein